MPPRPAPPRPPQRSRPELGAAEMSPLEQLAEVERALAALEGRSTEGAVDVAVARKEAEKRRDELRAVLAQTDERFQAKGKQRRVALMVGAGVVALVAIGAAVASPKLRELYADRQVADAAGDRDAAPYLRSGFQRVLTAHGLEAVTVETQRGRCYLAIASSAHGTTTVRVVRAAVTSEGAGSAAWCSCAPETLTVSAVGADPALVVLAIGAAALGGPDLLDGLAPRPGVVLPEKLDRACAEESIDAWLGAMGALDAPEGLSVEEKPLGDAGMKLLGRLGASAPALAMPDLTEACFIARSREASDSLTLRLRGGARPVSAHAAIGFCAASSAGLSVWREGKGEVTVLSAPASRVGGRLGLTELARRTSTPLASWVGEGDFGLDARAALAASGIGPQHLVEAGGADAPSLVSVSLDPKAALTLEARGGAALCRPALTRGIGAALCVESRAGGWQPPGGFPKGAALAKKPTFLPLAAADPKGLERTLDVLAFARRMSLAGFEQTTLVGVSETPQGAEVIGRAGEKEIVAIALCPSPPYVHVLSKGKPWSLEGEPERIALAPGGVVALLASPPYAGPKGTRELVVFRR